MIKFISPKVGSLKLKNKEFVMNCEAETVKKNKELQAKASIRFLIEKKCI